MIKRSRTTTKIDEKLHIFQGNSIFMHLFNRYQSWKLTVDEQQMLAVYHDYSIERNFPISSYLGVESEAEGVIAM